VSPYASNPLQPLIDFFEAILKFFHDTVGFGWGLSIIVMTLVVRACLLPLTLKQFHGMQRLAKVQPEIKRLQEKYKHDRERLNQEMMRFYRENKVNPFASCLPLVAQLPVFFSLFYMLRKDLRFDICPEVQTAAGAPPKPPVICGSGGDAGFLFIPDLTDKATGWVLAVLIILYVGSQLFSTLLMSTTTDRNQKMIMLALPFVFVIFVIQFPAGLLLYWITTNCWTIVQQLIVRRTVGVPGRRPALAGAGAPAGAAALARGRDGGASAVQRALGRRTEKGADEPAPAKGSGNGAAARAGPPPSRRKKKRTGRRR
jgi:YidC/Oxa1 family membrane protein insertase